MTRLIDTVQEFYCRYEQIILYLFWGVVSVVFNIGNFFLLNNIGFTVIFANTAAFVLTILFAYVTNTFFVFKEKFRVESFYKFVGFRFLTVFIDTYGVVTLINLGVLKIVSKITMNIVIVIINYILSKFVIYERK